MIILTYVENCIIVGPSMDRIDSFVGSMKTGKETFVLTDEGDINKFLGIEITQLDYKRFRVSQPFLVEGIVSFFNIDTNDYGMETNTKPTPVGKPLLHKDLSGKACKEYWNYCTAVGIFTYLQANIRPEMSIAVHQTARFCNKPMMTHEKAIKRLGGHHGLITEACSLVNCN